jgi:uncharacterized protein YodC (DUF2158 family)
MRFKGHGGKVMDFKVGELVRLKSGGPLMVVATVDEETICCTWRDQGDRQVQRETFSAVVLEKVRGSAQS